MAGIEPATSRSRTERAPYCATFRWWSRRVLTPPLGDAIAACRTTVTSAPWQGSDLNRRSLAYEASGDTWLPYPAVAVVRNDLTSFPL